MSSDAYPRLVAHRRDAGWTLTEEGLVQVVELLKRGQLVVYPTDTLYGLGADPYDPLAVERLYRAKRRPRGEPISLLVADKDQARRLARFSPLTERLWDAHLPGPLTLLLPATPEAPLAPVTREAVVGLRMPDHGVPLLLAREFGPLTATSANLHRVPPPRTVADAQAQLKGDVALYVDAGPCPPGGASTVVDCTQDPPTVKREGALSRRELDLDG